VVRLPEEAFRDPDRFSCESRCFADVTNGRKGKQLSKAHTIESSEESECQTIGDKKKNRSSGEVQWNFRRRDVSDRSSQPHSAPAGIAAQQSENFQRFYRAVVSPTHVRVTAGGRIVPNTRSAAPPIFEWNGDKFHFEPKKPEIELDQRNLQSTSWLQNAHPPPGFPPLISSGFLPPYNLLPRGNSIAMATMTSQIQPGHPINSNQPLPINGEGATGLPHPAALPQQIKISPPTQFDQTKPFMYNGHLVYPVPPGFQPPPSALPVPISMLGNPSFLPQNPIPPPTGFYAPQFPGPLPNMGNPFMFPAGQQLPMGISNATQTLENAPALPPYFPMAPPMLSVSDLIKSQIQFLQGNLSQLDHQVANNKNQVDETFMAQQRAAIMNQIDNMKTSLETQLAVEAGPKISSRDAGNQGGLGISMTSSQENTPDVVQSSNEASKSVGVQGDSTKPTTKTKPTSAERNDGDKKFTVRSDSTSKSRLTMAAAMAPPFQPRTQTAIAEVSQVQLANEVPRSILTSPIENIPFETQAQIESRLLARSSTDWGYSGLPNIAAMTSVTLSRTQSDHEPSTHKKSNEQPPVLQKFNTFHGQTNTEPISPPIISPNAVPYLIGSLPNGIQASQAKDTDFEYSRPLTEDEVRARFLYWGKAPRSVQSGLPKFDGKDFYPPSPVKQDVHLASVTPVSNTMGSQSVSATIPQLNFENLFDSPAESPRQAFSRRAAQYSPNSATNKQAQFSSPGNGYGESSFRLGGAGLSDWSTLYGRVQDIPHQPQTPPRPIANQNLVITPVTEDFSHLFLERGVPGYKSPSPLRTDMQQSRVKFDKEPVTPKNPSTPSESERGLGAGTVDSEETINFENRKTIKESVENDASSTTSTVEIHLSPQNKKHPPEISFAERVENFRRYAQIGPYQCFTFPELIKSIALSSKPFSCKTC
jgi:hypothetical protein